MLVLYGESTFIRKSYIRGIYFNLEVERTIGLTEIARKLNATPTQIVAETALSGEWIGDKRGG